MVTPWGRAHRFKHDLKTPAYLFETPFGSDAGNTTFHGQGRSYGDVALNSDGTVVVTKSLNRLIHADWDAGIVRAEAGLSLDHLLQMSVPKGWFLSVTPGSKFVSLGGAVANDVHGKNHHKLGSFGAHVRAIGLRRSDRQTSLTLSPTENADLFALTISGLGLTGLIEWVEVQMQPIQSPMMEVENIPFDHLDHFFDLSAASKSWDYTVAWVDCFAKGKALGRGIFTRGMHARQPKPLKTHPVVPKLTWPVSMPGWVLNKYSISAFNLLYRNRPGARFKGQQPYDAFFYPLDGIAHWNRLYGANGFYQHQSIIPSDRARDGVQNLLETISAADQGSFLAVLKSYGPETSPGRNSFCLEGTSLALDFANKGAKTKALLQRLDEIVVAHGGRMYPAKDGLMSAQTYQKGYPNWRDLEAGRDPALTSAFWQRVTQDVIS